MFFQSFVSKIGLLAIVLVPPFEPELHQLLEALERGVFKRSRCPIGQI